MAGWKAPTSVDKTLWRKGLDLDELVGTLRAQIGSFEYSVALQRLWRDVVDSANRYIQETQPFKLAKSDLSSLPRGLRQLGRVDACRCDLDQAVLATDC